MREAVWKNLIWILELVKLQRHGQCRSDVRDLKLGVALQLLCIGMLLTRCTSHLPSHL